MAFEAKQNLYFFLKKVNESQKMNKNFIGFILFLCFIFKTSAKDEKQESYGTVIGIDLGTTYSW